MRIRETERQSRVLEALLVLFVLGVIALGAMWGFPVQDDGYVFRLLRAGGPRAFVEQHADRPLIGFVLAEIVGLFGEHKFLYITVGLLAWVLFAAETAALWKRLYPERPTSTERSRLLSGRGTFASRLQVRSGPRSEGSERA